MYSYKNVTFFFPYPHVSGIPILFSNLANYMLEFTDLTIYIIDYDNGALIRNCKKSVRLKHIIFNDFESCELEIHTFLILQAGLPYKLREELKIGKNVKIIQWAAFEYNLIPFLSKISFIRKLQEKSKFLYNISKLFSLKKCQYLKKWVEEMTKNGSIIYMNKPIFDTTSKYLNLTKGIIPTYLPNLSFGILNFDSDVILRKYNSLLEEINFAWVGRIADFKIHILNYSLFKISEYAKKEKKNVIFHIIGEGEYNTYINMNTENNYFKIIRVGYLEKNKVDVYLNNNIQLLFAMGTSAIDGARLGIPVVLLDQSYSAINKPYKFKYLHNTINYDLGHPINENDFEVGNDTLEKIFEDMKFKYINICNNSFQYYYKNHEIKKIATRLIDILQNNSYSIGIIPKELVKQGLFRKCYIFYLKNIKKSYYF
jgi:hypothetical protein